MKGAFVSSKNNTNLSEVTKEVTSQEILANLPAVDYNIVDNMKKVRANISMF